MIYRYTGSSAQARFCLATVGGIVASGDGVEYKMLLLILQLYVLYEDATYQPSGCYLRSCSYVCVYLTRQQYG